jgi:hypothetical protein
MGHLPCRLRSDYGYWWTGTFVVLNVFWYHKCCCYPHRSPDPIKSESPPFQFNSLPGSAGFEGQVEVDHCDYPAPEDAED